MVIRVSNKNTNIQKENTFKRKSLKKANISFGDIFANIELLKAEGLISVSSVDISIANAIRRFN